jgi:putative peptidoglycan lipid II flippase
VLFPRIGAPGIAVASAIAGWVNAALLAGLLMRRGFYKGDAGLIRRVPRILVATLLMGAALWYGADWLAPSLSSDAPFLAQVHALALLILGGAAVYGVAALGLGGIDLQTLKRNLRRGGKG